VPLTRVVLAFATENGTMSLTSTKKRSLSFVLLIGSFWICGCDGAIRVKGRVYAQRSTAGESQAFVDQAHQANTDITPVKDAKVTLYHAGDYSSEKVERSELRRDSAVTDTDGSFEVGGLTSPFRFNAGMVIEKDGYKTITKVFYHDKLEHVAIIILVPDAPRSKP
jgi:hypothetical protein